ncbi:Nn.00g062660.m01.CDS01 [Neocucurbitaria sp. VM-36]
MSLKNSSGWYDYYVTISDKAMIKNKISADFGKIAHSVPPAQREFEERRRFFLLLGTDTLTMPLTIVSALEDMYWTTKDTLKIHVLGATGREFLAMSSFEEILHLLPALKALHVTAIGPSAWLDDNASQGYMSSRNSACCDKCESTGRQRSLASYKGLYHSFARASFYERPDLIVAFNSGCADGDDAETSWAQTIRHIVDSNIPSLFTTYNAEEAQHERAKMQSLNARFLIEPEENKWKGLVPQPELLDREFEMWFQNCWRYIIQGKI